MSLKALLLEPEWISQKLNQRITPEQAAQSLETLVSLGLIKFDQSKGKHVKEKEDFETNSQVNDMGVVQFHRKMIDLAKVAIDNLPPEEREIVAVTLALDSEGKKRIKKEVEAFSHYLMFDWFAIRKQRRACTSQFTDVWII